MELNATSEDGVTFIEGAPNVRAAPEMTGTEASAALVEACVGADARGALPYAEQLPAAFFDVSPRTAGEMLRRLRNYGVRLAVVVPEGWAGGSSRFGEMVAEEQRGRDGPSRCARRHSGGSPLEPVVRHPARSRGSPRNTIRPLSSPASLRGRLTRVAENVPGGTGKVEQMFGKPFGIVVLAAALLAAGLAGIAAFWAAWPRTSNTSPLAALFALAWSCTYIAAAHLTWRRSRFASPAFLAAMGFLLLLSSFIFPGGGLILLPPFAVISLLGFLGYRYLGRAHEPAA